MLDLGTVRPGSTIRIPFSSFDKDDGSAITMTSFAAADILAYKDGGTTERASTAGYTATTDFDAKTGKHLAIIDLADNTTAGFWAAGSEYLIAIDAVTIDAVTTGGWIARFRIGYVGAMIDTTIASLSTQTSFTLTAGPAEDDALNGCSVIIHDVASAVQCGLGIVSDYTGASKTVTLAAGTTFTAAATDNISIMFPQPMQPTVAGRTLDVSSGGEAGLDWANVGSQTTAVNLSNTTTNVVNTATAVTTVNGLAANTITAAAIAADAITAAKIADGAIDANTFAAGAITASAIAADAIGASELAADAVAEIADAIWDEAQAGHVAAGSFGEIATEIADILTDTGTTLQAELDGIQADTEDIQTRLPAALVSGRIDASVGAMAANVITAAAISADAITDAKVAADVTIASVTGSVGSVTGLTNTSIADQVWDELVADHAGVGSTGAALAAAGSAGDPWSTALPGAYGAGTAGKIIGDNLNATVSSRATQASVDTVDDFLDTEIAAILADTNELQTDWVNGGRLDLLVDAIKAKTDSLTFTVAGQVDANIQYVNDVAVTGTGAPGNEWGP